MKKIIVIILIFFFNTVFSQNNIVRGKITHGKKSLQNCNIYVANTILGTVSDQDGNFELVLKKSNIPIKIIFSHVGYQEYYVEDTFENLTSKAISVTLVEINNLNEIVIFSDKKVKAGYISGLSALDLITTPTALGDAMTAISTSLPGNQIDPNDGRFFVRGGDHYETKIFINDLNVHTPFNTNGPSLPNRGRFSPFLFDGIAFSAGGFEAEYGRALSSVLLMNTKPSPVKNETELSIKSVGLDAGISRILTKNISLTGTLDYTHLGPYRAIFPSRYKWNEDYNTLASEIGTIINLKNGFFKSYNKYDQTRLDYDRNDFGFGRIINTRIYEKNFYSNNSLNLTFNDTFKFYSGLVYSNNQRDIYGIFSDQDNSFVTDKLLHFKARGEYNFHDIKLKLKVGLEHFFNTYYINYVDHFTSNQFINKTDTNTSSSFMDVELKISNKLMLKTGIRNDYTDRLNENVYSPRVRLNYEIIPNLTISPYYGVYNQSPQNGHLIFDFEKNLKSERAFQQGLNVFWNKDKRLIYVDAYKKEYKNLVKYDFAANGTSPSNFNNLGKGYANGVDVFFWDRKSIDNFEYRLSYTYIDAKRDYEDYPGLSYPGFYSKHNASVVTKYWAEKIRSLISISYIYSSGNPYTNPNKTGFNNSFTKPYNSLNLSYSYLLSNNLFIYSSISNILDFSNIASYDYTRNPNTDGVYEEQEILPSSDQFFFIGMFYKFGGTKQIKNKINEINN
ncbi:TonB-dependent receptor [Flavobacterium sp. GT3R68]|uniref:TonB-dependent receptor n=1 Tax=Flavobacterium sp. GT3R68 TaxID=2594437 RepID=UPI000F8848D0|nr:TonB-dependent receptor [Flavobacterium sp. GT3R68]RTY89353.1 TonB-dependent receptor [Flavobacterium sp. GSN2]TRW93913.1 hypothetical protein FNW07_03100 [Flavobacterium sp. GT3R68]